MLNVKEIDVYIQSSHILNKVSLSVGESELVCLVGRNGAGRTTILQSVLGFLTPDSGSIQFKGEEITGLPPYEIARRGFGYAPEGSAIFSDLTVKENIEISTWTRKTERSADDRIDTALRIFPVLKKYLHRKGDHISGGERKMLSIARALALDSEFLILDEPFEGLSPTIIPEVARGVAEITKMGHSVLMAESNISHVPEWAAKVYVIERGEIIFEGSPTEVYEHKEVLEIIGRAGNDERACTWQT